MMRNGVSRYMMTGNNRLFVGIFERQGNSVYGSSKREVMGGFKMTGILMAAIITITLALVFYTIGVWSEHRSKQLKKIHLIFFWLGLCMDTTGTILMGQIAEQPIFSGKLSLHGITGMLAIILMIVHAIWATIVLVKNNEDSAKNFHRLSIAVWAIWLVPYILGMMIGMR